MRTHCIVATLSLALAAEGAERALDEWRAEAEQLAGARIEVLPVGAGLTPALPPVVAGAMSDPAFRENLAAAHALTINWEGVEGRAHYVLLNLALAEQWKDAEEGLLAHEIGHVWLNARGYRSPPYEPGPKACLAIHSGDIPQHVLIRREMRRRGIDGDRYWRGNLRLAMQLIERGQVPSTLEPCQRLTVLSQWMDARLGASPDTWAEWECFEEMYAKTYPQLKGAARALEKLLRGANLEDRDEFARVATQVRNLLEAVFSGPEI